MALASQPSRRVNSSSQSPACRLPPEGENGNISLDPCFCGDIGDGIYYLQSGSPCAPGNHPHDADCDLIGALPVGCDETITQATSWSAVKTLY